MSFNSGDRQRSAFSARVPTVDYGVLDELVGYAVRRVQLMVTEAFDAELADSELTTQRFSAMVLIARNPGLKQTELATIIGARPPQVSLVIDALVNLGLVERRPLPGDRRAHTLFTTPTGAARLAGFEAAVRAHDLRVTASLSATDRRQLKALLDRIGAVASSAKDPG